MLEKGKVLDLFTSIDNITLTTERAELTVVCAIEDSAGEAEIYQRNFGEKAYLCTTSDMTAFSRLSNIDYVCGMLPFFYTLSSRRKQGEMQTWNN